MNPDDGRAVVALALGANLGDAERTLRRTVEALAPLLHAPRVAALYRSAPEGGPAQPDYTNTALVGLCELGPEALLAVAKAHERSAGRRPGPRHGPRPLDVDLLLWGDRVCRRPELTLPHPRLTTRRFVLEPLLSVAGDLAVPPDGATVAELHARLPAAPALERRDWHRRPNLG